MYFNLHQNIKTIEDFLIRYAVNLDWIKSLVHEAMPKKKIQKHE